MVKLFAGDFYSYYGRNQRSQYVASMGRYKWSEHERVLLELLREVRREAGLSGPAVQRMLKRPNSYVAKVEAGEKRLDILELRELCTVYGITIVDFTARLEQRLQSAKLTKS